ncbi:hypothetical protein J8L85_08550 [Maribacter sp. MMG018]|uniref:hypothetical protein n=1 Tax=Maribacter sp. MMG018 TaxID=2822688 RepID=UPI001B36E629|nr:hypothetical protein [Maribacter sp. MMG018]MBQ4914482.1 hypothetical protein [Maribacter sp. MMG018]
MKIKVFLLLLMANTYLVYSQGVSNAAKHVGAGIVIGGVGGYAAHEIFNGRQGWTWAGSFGSSLAAGLIKESYDKANADMWQTDDVVFTALGGFISGLVLDLILENNRRGGGRSGKNCGCLVAFENTISPTYVPIINEGGSRDIGSEIQASYLLK